jgi:nondiscriminating glutamyl-tRNA synthetase
MSTPVVTRFAPSPTGAMHLGNARTALFNWLFARGRGGRFLVRIEDTDRARSDDAQALALLEELAWLGLEWDAGPDREDALGPYRQSARTPLYATAWQRLIEADRAYPCYCTPLELELARKVALGRGQAPRYAGTCAQLDAAARAARAGEGRAASLRFRVPVGADIRYQDLVRGPQQFHSDELGDFVIRRADGGATFLFCNLVDDVAMGVSHVLRGEDHVANTPRQLLLAQALGAAAPDYGHLPLLVGGDGAPLSKRHGSAGLAELRAAGYLPAAVANLLARLGHAYTAEGWLDDAAMIRHFDVGALGRAPARFDPTQLLHWQKEAVHRAPVATLEAWARGRVPPGSEAPFIAAVRANLVLPQDAADWGHVIYGELPCASGEARAAIIEAGPAFFAAALAASEPGADYARLIAALKAATGRSGRALYRPLRAALTQRFDGPELAQLLAVIPAASRGARLVAARELAARAAPGLAVEGGG